MYCGSDRNRCATLVGAERLERTASGRNYDGRMRLRAIIQRSLARRLVDRAYGWDDGSRVVDRTKAAGETTGKLVRNSHLYQWLTTVAEPEVVCLDLRETYAVGSVAAALDRAREVVGETGAASRVACSTARAVELISSSRVAGLARRLVETNGTDHYSNN